MRALYSVESFQIELDHTVYALDTTTIDLCLYVLWADFRSTKAAVKLHALLELRGAIPNLIHISDGKLHDFNVLDSACCPSQALSISWIAAIWASRTCTC